MQKYKTLLTIVAVLGLAAGVSNAALSVITVQDNFNDGDYTNNPTWTGSPWQVTDTWTIGGTRVFPSDYLVTSSASGNSSASITTPSGSLVGKWELEFDMQWGLGGDYFRMEVVNGSNQGYGVYWHGDNTIRIVQRRTATDRQTLASSTLAQNNGHHYQTSNPFYTVKLVREDRLFDGDDTNDNIWLYVDDNLIVSFNEADDTRSEFDANTATTLYWMDRWTDSRKVKLLDDVTLSTVPEPATITLLLLGLPLALRRRRK